MYFSVSTSSSRVHQGSFERGGTRGPRQFFCVMAYGDALGELSRSKGRRVRVTLPVATLMKFSASSHPR